MVDFMRISTRSPKRGTTEIYPKFRVIRTSDLMIRGGDFYAVWVEERGLWSRDEFDAIQIIDRELDIYAKEHEDEIEGHVVVLHLQDADTGMIDRWHKYCRDQMRDNYHTLDQKLIFSNTPTKKEDYASKRLAYPLEPGKIDAYERLVSTLYSETEREKIEWAIGAVVSGDSKKIQKFCVLYGAQGTGKSTILKIIEKLFKGYTDSFKAKSLGSSNDNFALEQFKANPLVAIDHEGSLSRIEDNATLNSLISHDRVTINEKFKSAYTSSFETFLFIATNQPVRITDAKSGLIRRLIDISPTGNTLKVTEYNRLFAQIDFELGAIAKHCLDVYLADPHKYDAYTPLTMIGATNDFYNFIEDSYPVFHRENGTTLKSAWEMYKLYCTDAKVPYPMPQYKFKEELKNYFDGYFDRFTAEDGSRIRSKYVGFKSDKFHEEQEKPKEETKIEPIKSWLEFNCTKSLLDDILADEPAQYAVGRKGVPELPWAEVKTTLKDLNTNRLHYVNPQNKAHIFIDFDLKDENGEKSLDLNLEAASKWPQTYAELSKSGAGIHLHYLYSGDPEELRPIFDTGIEVKTNVGNSAFRRKLTKCNDIPVATLSSGLPLKEKKQLMVNEQSIQSEKGLRQLIKRHLNKEIMPSTKSSIDMIYKILEEVYAQGLHYDVSDMRQAITVFAMNSTNQANTCLKTVAKMRFKSEEASVVQAFGSDELIFYDVEVFPNLFLVNWKVQGEGKPVIRMINPTPEQVETLLPLKLVGFNCRKYDNHMLYARHMGYSEAELYKLSMKIIGHKSRDCFFGEAYNLSYTDVYDFCSKKQSLKKWEIELGIHHKELGLPWNKPVPEEMWEKVAEYCDNDVLATEAVFNARQADFTARQILADIAHMSVNDTTNQLTTRIIFGTDKHPQTQFNYRNMGKETDDADNFVFTEENVIFHDFGDPEFTKFDRFGRPIFPGYAFEGGHSLYRGEDPKEGGYVFSRPGMYTDVALLDIESMHPSSIIAEQLFGPKYTQRFKELKDARLAIKHHDYDTARKLLNGALAPYLTDEESADALSQALKIVINSVYGLTSASFDNPFRDPRNIDNIVAKRGALFMINLRHEVENQGFIVAHIKTDSIKIPNATPEIIKFVQDYGKMYGYNFEHEATYDRMCLVNDAVYIAKYETAEHCERVYGYSPKDNRKKSGKWTATGTQFQVPYVFKTLFSREPIEFSDLCEAKSVSTAIYLDKNEGLNDPSVLEKELQHALKTGNANPAEIKDLRDRIDACHCYVFVGRVGLFCPIKPGCGGGVLLRQTENEKTGEVKYNSVGGAKDYRWLEAEEVKAFGKENDIDRSYYDKLVDEAVESISQYGDFSWFTSNEENEPEEMAHVAPFYAADVPWEEETTPFDVR